MKKYIWLFLIVLFLFPSLSFSAVELDTDSDGYIDKGYMPLDELWTFGAGITISTGQAFTLGTTRWDDGADKMSMSSFGASGSWTPTGTFDFSGATVTYRAIVDADIAAGAAIAWSKITPDSEISALAGLTSAADKVPQFTGSGTAQLLDIAIKSDCSGITAGFCMDSDNGYFYVWNGSSVQQIQGVAVDIVGSANINWTEPLRVPFGSGAYTSGTDSSIEFGDAGNYIWTPTDAELHLVSDGTIKLDANTVVTGDISATTYETNVSAAELGYLANVTSDIQTQFGTKVTGPGSSTDNAVAVWNSTTGYLLKNSTLIYAAGDLSGMDSITMNASAIPSDLYYDSDALGADKYAGRIAMDMTTVTDGAEVTDINIKSQVAGADSLVAEWDGSDEAWILGDSVSGEDLKFDFETATDNQVEISSNSGVTEVSFSAINVSTTGVIKGRAEYGTDVTASTNHDTTELHGVFYHFTAAATVTLDAAADAGYGAQACYRVRDAAEAAVIDVQAGEKVNLNGTALAAGTAITATGAGETVCMVATTDTDGTGTDGWETWGASPGWASE